MPKGTRRSAGGDRTDGSARPRSLSLGHGGPARPEPRSPLSPRRSALRPPPPAAPAARPPRGFRPPGRGRPHVAPRRPPSRATPPSWPGPGPPPRGLRAEHGRRCPSAPARPPLCAAQAGGARPMCSEGRSARLGSALPRRRDAGLWRRGAGRSAGRGGGGQAAFPAGARAASAASSGPRVGTGGETAALRPCGGGRGRQGQRSQQTAARTALFVTNGRAAFAASPSRSPREFG